MAAKDRKILSIQDAMEQNAEFFGFDLCDRIDIGSGEILEIPYRELLAADVKKKVDQAYLAYESCDRQEVEVTDADGKTTKISGAFKEPRQKDGVLFDLDETVSVALWGEERYQRYVAAGGPPGLVLMTWGRMRQQITKRMAADSKSD